MPMAAVSHTSKMNNVSKDQWTMKTTAVTRIHQIVFFLSFSGLCWLGMMAVHELGYVIGALSTGGRIQRVVLHPAAISRTDFHANPAPIFVVWAGPILGGLLPVIGLLCFRRPSFFRSLAMFFAGFCLIANGAYIGVGGIEGIGDAGEMRRHGTPVELMLFFGISATVCGFWFWHRLGSVKMLATLPETSMRRRAKTAAGVLVAIILIECLLSPKF